jgi:hypothetical protein
MIGSRWAVAWTIGGCLLAAGVGPLPRGVAAEGFPENRLRVAWSPNREGAVMVDELPSPARAEVLSDTGLSPSLMTRRPRNLSRPAPGQMRPIFTEAAGAEPLPAATGELLSPEGLPVPPGFSVMDGGMIGPGGAACCDAYCPDCCGPWRSCGPVPPCCLLPCIPYDNLEFFGGVQGFTGPLNRGGSGSFGFHEGFNWGIPFCGEIAWQWGMNWTQSNFDGNYLTEDQRNQIFLTGGFFRRVDWGLQCGLVVDYLHDEWDYTADLVQLRGELSWLYCGCHEVGMWFTAGVHEANNLPVLTPSFDPGEGVVFDTQQSVVQTNDMLAFFYRRQLACGGEGRAFVGLTTSSQALLGADAVLPINPCWSLRGSFLYITPDGDKADDPNFTDEAWNVGISLVWTPCGRSLCGPNYCRPLFNVADNGSFTTRLSR